MPSSKKVKLVSHGSTSGTAKKTTKRAVNKAEVAVAKGDKATKEYWQAYWDEIGVDNDDKKTTKRAVKEPKTVTTLRKKVAKEMDRQFIKAINDWDEIGIDNDPGIDVPLHARGLTSKWNFQKTKKRMPWYDKVTWVLTAVNVTILISLIVKNI